MALAQDLMGIGVSPLQALHGATGGSGPLYSGSVAGTTSSFSSATKIAVAQYVVTVSGAVSTGGVSLPTVGGDTGCLLADNFVVNNSGTTTIYLFSSSGVTISTGGSNTSWTQIPVHTTMTLWPLSTTQWIGTKGT
jgi:hypothetical protein